MILFSEPVSARTVLGQEGFDRLLAASLRRNCGHITEKTLLDIKIAMFFGISAAASPRLQVAVRCAKQS
jgi:hypothetical protein